METGYWDNVTDNSLVNNVKNSSCEESLLELANRHTGLCFKIMKKYAKTFCANDICIQEKPAEKSKETDFRGVVHYLFYDCS